MSQMKAYDVGINKKKRSPKKVENSPSYNVLNMIGSVGDFEQLFLALCQQIDEFWKTLVGRW